MKLIPCPVCGPRNSSDLRYVGESRPRPSPTTAGKAEWRAHLYLRENPAGWITETWYCRSGCRRYFVLERNTLTGAIRSSRLPAAQQRLGSES